MLRQSKQKNIHLLFDGEKIVISSNIRPVFDFLIEIEKEIKVLFNFQKQLDEIRKDYLEILGLVKFLAGKLKENNINFEYNKLKKPLGLMGSKLRIDLPVRSQMIVLFAALEVLYFLNIAYDKEIDNEKEMRNNARDDKNMKKFINSFLLNNENGYYKKNEKRFKKINSGSLRNLRNSLTHFFSLSEGGLGIIPRELIEKSIKLENLAKINKHGNIIFITPEDLYELIKSAHILRFKKWTEDFEKDKNIFERKMKFVINLVEKYGAVIVPEKNLKIQ